ncbi:MAG: small-conductance mechanosensitive channel [Planctomycetota bacterium]|jgi:small-conductance mechanosensitive channel
MNESIQSISLVIRDRLSELLSTIPEYPDRLYSVFSGSSPTGAADWHLLQILIGVGIAVIGYLSSKLVDGWGRKQFRYLFNPEPIDRAEKIGYLMSRAAIQFVSVAVMFTAVALLAILFHQSEAQRADFLLPVTLLAVARVGLLLFSNILAPDVPGHRLLSFDDDAAKKLHKSLVIVFSIGFGLSQIVSWLIILGIDKEVGVVANLLVSSIAVLLLSYVTIGFRREIAYALRGGRETVTKGVMFISNVWHVLAISYFLSAWVISAARYILDRPNAFGLVASPVLTLLGALLLYSILLVLIDSLAKRCSPSNHNSASAMIQPGSMYRSMLKLGEYTAAVTTVVAAFFYLMWSWGLDVSRDGPILNLVDVLVVLFAGWLIYNAITLVINQKIENEGGINATEPGEEGGGEGRVTRIAMLLSLLKKFLSVTVLIIIGMMVLSELGIDIAPLFAGAGIVGLAIGFGAQTMVRDIFSGAFFLMDDAFRIGEYIDIGEVKGTVEKISVRSMQLRHHMGALHTVPFGEIKYLTNYSRDWVMMKLKLRVTYETDIEKVRKLIKKLGQQLLQHPEVGEKFMQPLKSQGVYSMEDENAIVIRVKFMTKPGDQFQTRKVVYQSIRDLFHEENIRFATQREVLVRVADAEQMHNLDKEIVGAAAAEALRVSDKSQHTGNNNKR